MAISLDVDRISITFYMNYLWELIQSPSIEPPKNIHYPAQRSTARLIGAIAPAHHSSCKSNLREQQIACLGTWK